MPSKRVRDESANALAYTPSRSPKRRQLAGSLPPSSPIPSSSSAFTTPRTPAYNWKVPADSPTNPFGRICRLTQGTTLPRPTSYSKHLPLRFQFIHPCVDGREFDKDGIYRIVQVPLNYTLAHLHKLIIYVFSPATDEEIVEPYSLRRSSRRMSGMSSSDKGKQVESEDPVGHLFEIQRKIKMGYTGQIKDAQTWVKASTMRDPYHYPGNDPEDSLWLEDGAGEEWKWEAEEDFALSKVWPKGGDLARGILYHHNAETQIHITVNTKKIQGRKGVGNMPFVFFSNGSLSLSNPEGTIRMGSLETLRWNRIGAFEKYLKAEEEKERAARGNEDDEDEDGEGELDPDPDMSSSTLPLYELSSSPFTISSNPVTPFPTEPSKRRRIDYERKRLLKLTKNGMKEAGLSDEEEDQLAEDKSGKRHPIFEDKPFDWDPFGDEAEL